MEQERSPKSGIKQGLSLRTWDTISIVSRFGRVTDRNRQYLRQFSPITSPQPGPRPTVDHFPKQVEEPAYQPMFEPEPVVQPQQPTIPEPWVPNTPPRQVVAPQPTTPTTSSQPTSPTSPESPSFVTPPSTPVANEPPRRSTRVRKPIERLNYDKSFNQF